MSQATLTFTALNQRHVVRMPTHIEDFILQHTGLSSSGGAATGAIVAEGSNDGQTWVALEMVPVAGGASVASLAAAGAVEVKPVMQWIGIRMSVAGDLVAKIGFKEVI